MCRGSFQRATAGCRASSVASTALPPCDQPSAPDAVGRDVRKRLQERERSLRVETPVRLGDRLPADSRSCRSRRGPANGSCRGTARRSPRASAARPSPGAAARGRRGAPAARCTCRRSRAARRPPGCARHPCPAAGTAARRSAPAPPWRDRGRANRTSRARDEPMPGAAAGGASDAAGASGSADAGGFVDANQPTIVAQPPSARSAATPPIAASHRCTCVVIARPARPDAGTPRSAATARASRRTAACMPATTKAARAFDSRRRARQGGPARRSCR